MPVVGKLWPAGQMWPSTCFKVALEKLSIFHIKIQPLFILGVVFKFEYAERLHYCILYLIWAFSILNIISISVSYFKCNFNFVQCGPWPFATEIHTNVALQPKTLPTTVLCSIHITCIGLLHCLFFSSGSSMKHHMT